MGVDVRIKELRKKELGLTCNEFAEPLHVSGKLINMIENSKTVLTPRLANDICDVYHVNYQWLVEGLDVPMFVNEEQSIIDEVALEYGLSDNEKIIVEYYLKNPDKRQAVIDGIIELGERLKKGAS